MDREPFKRNIEGSRLYYDVLSSKKTFYYTVELLGLVAISCDCNNHVKGHKQCKHMTGAEEVEKKFQEVNKQNTQAVSSEAEQRLTSSLLGTRGFSLTR